LLCHNKYNLIESTLNSTLFIPFSTVFKAYKPSKTVYKNIAL